MRNARHKLHLQRALHLAAREAARKQLADEWSAHKALCDARDAAYDAQCLAEYYARERERRCMRAEDPMGNPFGELTEQELEDLID